MQTSVARTDIPMHYESAVDVTGGHGLAAALDLGDKW